MARKHILVALAIVTALWTSPVPSRAAVGVSATADATWGTEVTADNKAGRVLTVVTSGGRVYLGGDFTAASPPDSKDPAALVPREYLAAFGDGGTTLADWNPRADGEVRALLASPDGRRIYAGGMFKHIGGRRATRLAAIDAATGALDPTFAPPEVDGVVRALGLSPDGTVLYVGGDFATLTAADGTVESRPHLAALDAATGRLAPWLPPDDAGGRYYGQTGVKDKTRPGGVYAIAPSADGTTVHVGGTFLSFGGRSGLVSLDAATGQPTPWQAKVDRPIYGLTRGHDGHTFYAAAGGAGGRLYAFRPHGPPDGHLAGQDGRRQHGGGGDGKDRLPDRPLRLHRRPEIRLLPLLPGRRLPAAPLGLRPQRETPGLEPRGQHLDRPLYGRHRRRPSLRGRGVHEDRRDPPRGLRGVLRDPLRGSFSHRSSLH